MQNYINPIELLNLDTDNPTGIDGLTILKAKKNLIGYKILSTTAVTIDLGLKRND
jgi:hypothetical protein